MRSLSPGEASRFVGAARDGRWGALFESAVATGLRPSEYLGLKWDDVVLRAGQGTVRRLGRADWTFQETKAPKSRRTIPLPAWTIHSLTARRVKEEEERRLGGTSWQDIGVFAGEGGQPRGAHNLLKRHVKPILKAAGLPEDPRLYDLRHTRATLLLAGGINPRVVAERLGHSSIMLTMDSYSHVLPTIQAEAAGRVEALLYPQPGGGGHAKGSRERPGAKRATKQRTGPRSSRRNDASREIDRG